jgi:hypothetical protein
MGNLPEGVARSLSWFDARTDGMDIGRWAWGNKYKVKVRYPVCSMTRIVRHFSGEGGDGAVMGHDRMDVENKPFTTSLLGLS